MTLEVDTDSADAVFVALLTMPGALGIKTAFDEKSYQPWPILKFQAHSTETSERRDMTSPQTCDLTEGSRRCPDLTK